MIRWDIRGQRDRRKMEKKETSKGKQVGQEPDSLPDLLKH